VKLAIPGSDRSLPWREIDGDSELDTMSQENIKNSPHLAFYMGLKKCPGKNGRIRPFLAIGAERVKKRIFVEFLSRKIKKSLDFVEFSF
jgi:hypothetical protein